MGFLNKILGKNDELNPRKDVDWDVYDADFDNGMPYDERKKRLADGAYNKGMAKPSDDYGRIDNVELYEHYLKLFGKPTAETMRRKGLFMNN